MRDIKTCLELLKDLMQKLEKAKEEDSFTYSFYTDLQQHLSNQVDCRVMPKIADLTTGQKIDAILKWQNDERVHPLTCGCSATNNDEKKFEIVGKRLNGKLFIECTRCGVVQDWIPDCVYNYWIDSNFSV